MVDSTLNCGDIMGEFNDKFQDFITNLIIAFPEESLLVDFNDMLCLIDSNKLIIDYLHVMDRYADELNSNNDIIIETIFDNIIEFIPKVDIGKLYKNKNDACVKKTICKDLQILHALATNINNANVSSVAAPIDDKPASEILTVNPSINQRVSSTKVKFSIFDIFSLLNGNNNDADNNDADNNNADMKKTFRHQLETTGIYENLKDLRNLYTDMSYANPQDESCVKPMDIDIGEALHMHNKTLEHPDDPVNKDNNIFVAKMREREREQEISDKLKDTLAKLMDMFGATCEIKMEPMKITKTTQLSSHNQNISIQSQFSYPICDVD